MTSNQRFSIICRHSFYFYVVVAFAGFDVVPMCVCLSFAIEFSALINVYFPQFLRFKHCYMNRHNNTVNCQVYEVSDLPCCLRRFNAASETYEII